MKQNQHFTAKPTAGSIPITLTESLGNDEFIQHNYFISTQPFLPPSKYTRDSHENLLIEAPISVLLAQAEELLADKHYKSLSSRDSNGSFLSKLDSADNRLWMEKYEPRSFVNLITEDYVNREALTWLIHWGSKKEVKVEPSHINSFLRIEKDFKKPVLLMHGVPGGGKTTLAKVIAAHCKYVPWEMNCSLEGNDLIQKIRHALHIQNVKGLPVCIILDMVDCLDKDSMQQLQKIIATGKRPIIAIANDFYCGTLKSFKVHCYQLNCRSIHPQRVYNRLREICDTERIKIDMAHLSSVCSEYNHDIRSCLNNLQAMSSTRQNNFIYITREMIQGFTHHQMHRNVYDLWRFIFSSKNFKEAKKAVRNFGEYELVNSGIYENYNSFSNNDYDMSRSAELLVRNIQDSLALNDVFEKRIMEKQQFELTPFQCIPTLYANINCSSDTRELHFPVLYKNIFKAQTSCKDALKTLESDMTKKPGKLSYETILEDILPYLPYLLNRDYLESERNLHIDSYLIFKELGFELINGVIEPAPIKIYNYIKGNIISPETLISFKHFHDGVNIATASLSSMVIDTAGYDALGSCRKRQRESTSGLDILYVFHEGLTNAVKRRVRVSEFL